jgi:hypothetical protein
MPPGRLPARRRPGGPSRCFRWRGRTRGTARRAPAAGPLEPGAADLGHVADQAVQGEPGGCRGTRLPRVIVSAFALEQQRGAVELQPCLKHLPLALAVLGWLGSPRVLKVFHHEPEPTGPPGSRPGSFCAASRTGRPGPGSGAQTKEGSRSAAWPPPVMVQRASGRPVYLYIGASGEVVRICRDVIAGQWNSAINSILPTMLAFSASRSPAGIQYSRMVWPPTW